MTTRRARLEALRDSGYGGHDSMAGLTAIASPQLHPKKPFQLSTPALALSNNNPSTQRRRWRTRAVATTPGVADAKRAIDEVLTSREGGLTEVSWALYADAATKKVLADAVTELSACRGQDFGEFMRSGDAHGVWEVFYAPHIHA